MFFVRCYGGQKPPKPFSLFQKQKAIQDNNYIMLQSTHTRRNIENKEITRNEQR